MTSLAHPLNPLNDTRDKKRRLGLFVGMGVLFIASLVSIFVGTHSISPSVTIDAILSFDSTNSEHLLVQHLRIPRTFLAIVVGGALGIAGVIMQGLTRNPLADPGILGVNAGATVAVVSAIAFLGLSDIGYVMWFGLAGAAIAGAGVFVLAGINKGVNPVRVVLAGSALSVVLLALTHIITVNSDEMVFDQFRHWAVGSFQGRGYDVLLPVSVLILIGMVIAFSLAKALDTVSLGEDIGHALGVNPVRIWSLASISIVILAGASTAAAGPISFVGLTAPHIARMISGPDHKWLMPFSLLIASILAVLADVLGRIIGHPNEISVGIMIALIGGPFFVFLVKRWKISQL
ncbi:Ferric vibriobactin ABC transporter, permease protein [Vibrio nigripulchritudo SFn27]|uniref:Ferric vibriobactin ABC transporter, permease protein n=2 Tax=Vibrio nigripulchritudo TaxID=28173 RepID=U4KIC3_9VIBR|nr:iron ABC transporter permease [Vibrio nigripulchritudo]CCN80843.1 Ferric vibriobactin ABC transporter, permease protein [Vibrio nigripulchritudo BLFn1]CCN88041.1 Ferric vibriobactin ABC transporter, permease protein [Vibrio nigripulchritudo SFn27]CCN96895.1 Ferric vibriobactin ABC transporter, permease protein [Vibrio nigripulchritudo ENn2]CCO43452.1 Ferric vibriobactin ABC transporter, permease protein [Vibrio nigripulchritudo SFn135]CCO45836.1 Ferric vibriobactin ABC transporter, permease